MASLPLGPVDDAPDRAPTVAELLRPFAVVALVAAAMWVEEVVDLLPHTPFDSWGIRPRQLRGVPGIALAPFLHDGFGHLLSNTVPFVVLGCIVAASGVQRFVQVAVIVAAIAGVGTWLTGPSRTIHIGASGVVFGLLTYLVARGAFERRLGHLAVALLVLIFYGSLLWGLLPRPGVSWQGHLFGALGGVVAAWVIHGRGQQSRTTIAEGQG
ncbi:MAG TPA: rhomboid family intramembrane serine protease [Aquihabitans sp.]|nr:rhomboid family intramembrane serine protease [Aquihabitans sp.]